MLFAGAYIYRVALCWTVLTYSSCDLLLILLKYRDLSLYSSCDLVMLSVPGGCDVQLPPLDVTVPPSLLKDQV